MSETEIRIEGLDELIAKLKHIEGNIKPTMTKTMDKAIKYVHGTVPEYPPERPGQTYVRKVSAGLGGSITTEVKSLGSAIVGSIGSDMVYAPYVISKGEQAWMHKGRWWTLQKVVKDASNEIMGFFQEALQKLLRS